jgi:lipid II:glycine glycyltransferase (peptidoglycan interpeptide bridge formation enzyme)
VTTQPRRVDRRDEWNGVLADRLGGHLLQSWEWGELKRAVGWTADRLLWEGTPGQAWAGAQVLRRRMGGTGGLCVAYCPRGPALDWSRLQDVERQLEDLEGLARAPGVVFLKIDPDVPVGYGVPGEAEAADAPAGIRVREILTRRGWRESPDQIQFRNTLVLDLHPGEERLLAGMKQKTRYNIRLAERAGVSVRLASPEDFPLLYRLYAETSVRDGFVIRPAEYYAQAWGTFQAAGLAQAFLAEVEGEGVAGLVIYRFGTTASFLYGMSSDRQREKMPNYLLQWHAIRWARARGCQRYDMWGAPQALDESDPMWGVVRFKLGFGARMVRSLGAWDFTARPAVYAAATRVLPRLLALLRARGRRRTRLSLEA